MANDNSLPFQYALKSDNSSEFFFTIYHQDCSTEMSWYMYNLGKGGVHMVGQKDHKDAEIIQSLLTTPDVRLCTSA